MAGRSEGRQSDVSAMQKVSDQQYREYVRNQEILFLDPNRVLRLTESGAPLAATREQVDILIEELRQFRLELRSKRQ